MNSELLIIIPAYNEEENIEKVVNNIRTNYSQYDYIVVNDQLEACTERLHQLIEAQHSRIGLQKDFLDQIRQELKQFS